MIKRGSFAGLVLLVAVSLAPAGGFLFKKGTPTSSADAAIPFDELSDAQRTLVRSVVDKPTMVGRGPSETFPCRPEHYYWFLEHPDRAVTAWRRIGAKCASITPRGEGCFGWSDDQGSDLVWRTVYKAPGIRIWYAEGKVRPAPVLALVPVKAVLVLHHGEGKNAEGASTIQHRSELYLVTESKSATALTKLMGQSASKLAEQGLGQLQLFFSGVSWYIHRHPEKADELLKQ
jgi:hypothetical protein